MGATLIAPWQVSLLLAVLGAASASEAAAAAIFPSAAVTASPGVPGVPIITKKSSRCGAGRYWDVEQRRCTECTDCTGTGRQITIRPCDGHRDAQCGSLTDLKFDWSWLRTGPGKSGEPSSKRELIDSLSEAEAEVQRLRSKRPRQQQQQHERLIDFGDDYILPDHPRQPQHQKEKKKHKKTKSHHKAKGQPFGDYDDFADFGASGDSAVDSDDEDLVSSWRRTHHRPTTTRPTTTSTTTTTTSHPRTNRPTSMAEDFIVIKDSQEDRPDEEVIAELEASLDSRPRGDDVVVATTKSFTTAETLVWDWQSGVLVAAVCACLLFFIVAAAYSCQHAWHFKKLKKNLDADMEEISTRLALMSGMGSEHLHDTSGGHGLGHGALGAAGVRNEKGAFPVRRGDHLRTGRQQNEYCLATLPSKSRV